MNERIEGLWWKARIGYNNQSCDPEVLEKFAELLIKECAEVAEDYDGAHYVGTTIKQHFGVK